MAPVPCPWQPNTKTWMVAGQHEKKPTQPRDLCHHWSSYHQSEAWCLRFPRHVTTFTNKTNTQAQPNCKTSGSGSVRASSHLRGRHQPGTLVPCNACATACACDVDSYHKKACVYWWPDLCHPFLEIVTLVGLARPQASTWQRSHCSFMRKGIPSTNTLFSGFAIEEDDVEWMGFLCYSLFKLLLQVSQPFWKFWLIVCIILVCAKAMWAIVGPSCCNLTSLSCCSTGLSQTAGLISLTRSCKALTAKNLGGAASVACWFKDNQNKQQSKISWESSLQQIGLQKKNLPPISILQ